MRTAHGAILWYNPKFGLKTLSHSQDWFGWKGDHVITQGPVSSARAADRGSSSHSDHLCSDHTLTLCDQLFC